MSLLSILGCRRYCQPPCEAVSWNVVTIIGFPDRYRQPPCEAVSWNILQSGCFPLMDVSLLVRLWVEMLKLMLIRKLKNVSLLVRLWVEMGEVRMQDWFGFVSLLVRLWVEMVRNAVAYSQSNSQPPCEAVSWNMQIMKMMHLKRCQPPCEAVSWNITRWTKYGSFQIVSLLVRLWVEIWWKRSRLYGTNSQPPCEAVSWNSYASGGMRAYDVSLLVRLWVEITDYSRNNPLYLVSLLVRLWVEMSLCKWSIAQKGVSLLVRLWVEI